MKLIDRMLLSELLVPFLVGTLAVVLMVSGNMLFFYAEPLFAKGVPIVAVLQMIIYHTPYLLVLTLPVATALSVSLAVNRLARDLEIVVLRNAGASLKRIFLPLLVAGLAISVVNFWLEESVVPHAERLFRRVRDRNLPNADCPFVSVECGLQGERLRLLYWVGGERTGQPC